MLDAVETCSETEAKRGESSGSDVVQKE